MFTANDEYTHDKREDLLLTLQIQLPKHEPHSLSIFKIIECEKHGYLNTENILFLNPSAANGLNRISVFISCQ